jgi:beta-N-acetylhexosaminidase
MKQYTLVLENPGQLITAAQLQDFALHRIDPNAPDRSQEYTYTCQAIDSDPTQEQKNTQEQSQNCTLVKITLSTHSFDHCKSMKIYFPNKDNAKTFWRTRQDLHIDTYRPEPSDTLYCCDITLNILSVNQFTTLRTLLISEFNLDESSVDNLLFMAGRDYAAQRFQERAKMVKTLKDKLHQFFSPSEETKTTHDQVQSIEILVQTLFTEASKFDKDEKLNRHTVMLGLGNAFLSFKMTEYAKQAFKKIPYLYDHTTYYQAQQQLVHLCAPADSQSLSLDTIQDESGTNKKVFIKACKGQNYALAATFANMLCGYLGSTEEFITPKDLQNTDMSNFSDSESDNEENEDKLFSFQFKLFDAHKSAQEIIKAKELLIENQQQEIRRLKEQLAALENSTAAVPIPPAPVVHAYGAIPVSEAAATTHNEQSTAIIHTGQRIKMPVGPLIISLASTTLLENEKILLASPKVGGLVLFRENYNENAEDPKADLKKLIQEIRAINPNILIMIDHEGGRVWRFIKGFTKLHSAKEYGILYEQDSKRAVEEAFLDGQIMARELRECGIDMSLAPVVDLDGPSNVIGKLNRAYHKDPVIVTQIAQAFIRGMNKAGMPATLKHFPGHGTCKLDSHVAAPTDDRPIEELLTDLQPFANLINQKEIWVGSVMTNFVTYPAVDSDNIAAFSKKWIQGYLRQQYGFNGLVMSDCLHMEGANVGEQLARLNAAQSAGNDFLMYTHQHGEKLVSLVQILKDIPDSQASMERRERFIMQIEQQRIKTLIMYPNFQASNMALTETDDKTLLKTDTSSKP